MTRPIITTPRGTISINANNKAELKWNTDFQPKWQRRYSMAQRFTDSEVLRLCEPYTPLLTGMLVMSGTLGTEIGSGRVKWIAPYARRQYYSPRDPGSETGKLRGPFWFERMKAIYRDRILRGARRIAGGGSK
jgi:hypothetical protein